MPHQPQHPIPYVLYSTRAFLRAGRHTLYGNQNGLPGLPKTSYITRKPVRTAGRLPPQTAARPPPRRQPPQYQQPPPPPQVPLMPAGPDPFVSKWLSYKRQMIYSKLLRRGCKRYALHEHNIFL